MPGSPQEKPATSDADVEEEASRAGLLGQDAATAGPEAAAYSSEPLAPLLGDAASPSGLAAAKREKRESPKAQSDDRLLKPPGAYGARSTPAAPAPSERERERERQRSRSPNPVGGHRTLSMDHASARTLSDIGHSRSAEEAEAEDDLICSRDAERLDIEWGSEASSVRPRAHQAAVRLPQVISFILLASLGWAGWRYFSGPSAVQRLATGHTTGAVESSVSRVPATTADLDRAFHEPTDGPTRVDEPAIQRSHNDAIEVTTRETTTRETTTRETTTSETTTSEATATEVTKTTGHDETRATTREATTTKAKPVPKPTTTHQPTTKASTFDGPGACQNDKDHHLWFHGSGPGKRPAVLSYQQDLNVCAHKCWGGKVCVASCMMEKQPYTNDCAMCFGGISSCTASKCMISCIRGGIKCTECVAQECTPALRKCSGLPL
eukprot:TRINITY_DN3451_c0_g1_i1.p1 TRINITY_DN3451_c0_g1~~TRINITY_DN3451_c0_g1_i1.p1  ORF type:complete len:438 (-),score=46.29 TRINITY_DN3451_c0_g1_i1:212-1525(-)